MIVIGAVLVFNMIFVPSLLAQTQHSDEQFEAALTIAEHAAEHDRTYPENFVLSEWGDNRMYNYFVSGESRSYNYAQRHYAEFIGGADPDAGYGEFGHRVGYVVVTDADLPEETVHGQLYEHFGAGNESAAHFQLLYSAGEVRAFSLVEGAVINTTGAAADPVTARTDVTVMDESFTYERAGTPGEDGTVRIRVAYAGEYEVGGETVTVTEQAVRDGAEVRVDG